MDQAQITAIVALKEISIVFHQMLNKTFSFERPVVTPTLQRLHWLPIKSRIDFKIASMTFKVLLNNQPRIIHLVVSSWEITTFSGSQPLHSSSRQNCCKRQSFQCCCSTDLEQSTIWHNHFTFLRLLPPKSENLLFNYCLWLGLEIPSTPPIQ